jgi:hypothetical protein
MEAAELCPRREKEQGSIDPGRKSPDPPSTPIASPRNVSAGGLLPGTSPLPLRAALARQESSERGEGEGKHRGRDRAESHRESDG